MSEKKYSAKEAAVAVLKKAEELYKSSTLAKGDWKKIHDKLEREGYSKESADKIDGSIKAKLNKADDGTQSMTPTPTLNPDKVKAFGNPFARMGAGGSGPTPTPAPVVGKSDEAGVNPDAKADAALGEKVEQDVHAHEGSNEDPAHEAPMKGHIKLAKFIGRMEHKKSLRKGM
jgi:hypothetical protein